MNHVNIVTKSLEKSPIMTLKKEGFLAEGLALVKMPIPIQENCREIREEVKKVGSG